uniref:carboxypeptidase B-like n=1 Tax=Styela clava TaxID=7725 RepID=UPI00193A0798|nr:carboxypeptidase B-like [Styela clava]XP_039269248.1 carboxypeptidase B-like [Styela clava]
MNCAYFLLGVVIGFCLQNISFGAVEPRRYDGYRVVTIEPQKDSFEKIDALLASYQLDIWRRPSIVKASYDVLIAPEIWDVMTTAFDKAGAKYVITIGNVQQLIEKERFRRTPRRVRRQPRRFSLHRYHTLDEIRRWMYHFSRANRDIVKRVQVGISYQGRRIFALKIGVPSANITKRIIWQDACIHAREWVTGATLIWLSRKLVKGYREGNSDIDRYLTEFDWYILPIWNVDGYLYTWTKDRMWRKSRSEAGSYGCYGVDLNRNFETPNRGAGTASDNPCSEVYHGPKAFSELESSSVQKFMLKKRSHLAAVMTLHSYAQYWLYPYGYTSEHSPDNDELERISSEAVKAMHKKHNAVYKHGTVSDIAYQVSGGSIDWSYRELCVKYTFGVELRDTGKHGFLLPPRYIIPTAEEYYEGLEVVVRQLLQESRENERSSFCTQRRGRA